MPSEEDIPFIDSRRLKWSEDAEYLLGEGSFGRVYRGRYNGSPAAIKVLKRPNISDNYGEDYQEAENAAMRQHRREIRRFNDIRHAYIIQYYAVFRDKDPRDLYIVTEYLQGGSLHSSLTKMRARDAKLDIPSSLQIALHIAYGLNHVHEENYTHGDMKPHNVLLTSEFNFILQPDGTSIATFAPSARAKIADFGLSKRLASSNNFHLNATTIAFGDGPCGTYLYMSPEAYNGVNSLSDIEAKASDVYSFGLVLFELFSGMLSWRLEGVKNPIQLHKLVSSGQRPSWGTRQHELDPRYIELVSQCWAHDPRDRPPIEHVRKTLERYSHEITGGFISKNSYLPDFSSSQTQQPTASSSPQNISLPSVEPSASQVQEEQTENTITFNASNDDLTGKDIYNVESKDLTDSQAKELLRRSTSQPSDTREEDKVDPPQLESNNEQPYSTNTDTDYHRRPRVEDSDSYDDDSIENDVPEERHEIDKTFIGDTKVRRVESSYIPEPSISLLEISNAKNVVRNADNGEEALLGVGGGVDESHVPSILDSFLNAAGKNNSDTQTPSDNVPQSEHEGAPENQKQYTDSGRILPQELPGRAPGFPDFPDNGDNPNDAQNAARRYPSTESHTPDYLSTQNTKNKSYSSPAVEIDPEDLPELVENDRRALSEPGTSIGNGSLPINGSSTQLESNRIRASQAFNSSSPNYSDPNVPNGALNVHNAPNHSMMGVPMQQPHQQSHHIPALGNNNYSVGPGSTTFVGPVPNGSFGADPAMNGYVNTSTPSETGFWDVSGNNRQQVNQGMSIQLGVGPMNYNGITPHYGTSSHTQFGRRTNTSNGSSFSHDLSRAAGGGGEEELKRCRQSLRKNIEEGNGRDPNVAVKVCTEIGKIASSNPTRIRHTAVIDTLRDIVLVMYVYNQHPYSQGQVYAACNYALCNLLKVNNVIEDTTLRGNVASWIAYTIGWNIRRDGSHPDSFVVPVGHTAAAAARNFMWTKEDNVIAFVDQQPNGQSSHISELINSLKFYCDREYQIVVEATLAALTTLIYYPRQRAGFVQHHGIDVLIFVLEKYFADVKMSVLIFAELTVLYSGPTLGGGYLESLQNGLLVDKGVEKVIQILLKVLDINRNEKAELETIEKGLESLLTISRFSSALLHKVAETGSGPLLIRLLCDVSKNLSLENVVREQSNNAGSVRRIHVLVGKLVCALAEELGAISSWREKFTVEISALLEEISAKPAADEALVNACKAVSRVLTR